MPVCLIHSVARKIVQAIFCQAVSKGTETHFEEFGGFGFVAVGLLQG